MFSQFFPPPFTSTSHSFLHSYPFSKKKKNQLSLQFFIFLKHFLRLSLIFFFPVHMLCLVPEISTSKKQLSLVPPSVSHFVLFFSYVLCASFYPGSRSRGWGVGKKSNNLWCLLVSAQCTLVPLKHTHTHKILSW